MSEVSNITDNITKLREKRSTAVFGEKPPPARKNRDSQESQERKLRSSAFSWLAIGVVGALVIFQIISIYLFQIINQAD